MRTAARPPLRKIVELHKSLSEKGRIAFFQKSQCFQFPNKGLLSTEGQS